MKKSTHTPAGCFFGDTFALSGQRFSLFSANQSRDTGGSTSGGLVT